MSGVSNPYRYQYETVAASQTAQVLGGTGAVGDYVHLLIINAVSASGAWKITTGSGATVVAVGIFSA